MTTTTHGSALLPAPDDIEGDRVQPGHPLFGLVWANPERMGGVPCFGGTRISAQSLFEHLEAGDSLAVFLTDFPDVSRDHAVAVLEACRTRLTDGLAAE